MNVYGGFLIAANFIANNYMLFAGCSLTLFLPLRVVSWILQGN